MYGRNINFTLLAPSLWAVVEAIASNIEEEVQIALKIVNVNKLCGEVSIISLILGFKQ